MKTRDVVKYSGNSLRTQKSRSMLTILGVVIGIAAIVALLSLGNGFEASMTDQMESGFSTKTVVVGQKRGFGRDEGEEVELYVEDAKIIESIEHVDLVVPVIQKSVTIELEGESIPAIVYGVNFAKYGTIYETFRAELGEIPLDGESTEFVIGHGIHESDDITLNVSDTMKITWSERDGATLKEYSQKDEVVAVLPEVGSTPMGGGPSDYGVYIPIDLAMELFDTEEINSFILLLDDDSEETITQVSEDIEEAFFDQVSVTSSTSISNMMNNMMSTMTLFLGGIAGISLIVAGIGIMNIMFVSLMERTREIGILKALGMTSGKILHVFLFETMFIGVIGSILGIGAGWIFANLFGGMMFSGGSGAMGGTIAPVLNVELIVQALLYGVATAVLFGLYPAWRASRLKPVDALRYL